MLIYGPFSDNEGAMLVIRAESSEETERLVKDDPFTNKNYYKNYKIIAFTEANEQNNWLS